MKSIKKCTAVFATLAFVLPLAVMMGTTYAPAHGQEPTRAPQPPETPQPSDDALPVVSSSLLTPVTAALRAGNAAEAARLLKAMKPAEMKPEERVRWQRLASLVAVRVGDKAWRDQIVRSPTYNATSRDLILITAARLLQDGDDAECQRLLDQVKEPDTLSEIPRRRYYTLRARLAQFNGDEKTERIYLTRLVNLAGQWASPNCQACHANARRFGEKTTTLDVAHWWVGERFAQVVKLDAANIEREARLQLATNPEDGSARLRLAYAQRAQGKAVDAEASLRQLPWAEFSDREKRQPLRFSQFP